MRTFGPKKHFFCNKNPEKERECGIDTTAIMSKFKNISFRYGRRDAGFKKYVEYDFMPMYIILRRPTHTVLVPRARIEYFLSKKRKFDRIENYYCHFWLDAGVDDSHPSILKKIKVQLAIRYTRRPSKADTVI